MLSNGLVGFAVGIAGGAIGLGGAELRLPYLIGVLNLTPHTAVPLNLAMSLVTLLAAIPARLISLPDIAFQPYLLESALLAAGALVAAYFGAGWLRHLSAPVLARLVYVLLLLLGLDLIVEAGVPFASDGLLPKDMLTRAAAAVLLGIMIGAISSLLGVAGGEVIIPSLVFGFGVPIKSAGSLSIFISLPAVIAGTLRHARFGAYSDRKAMTGIVAPMAIGSIAGALAGGFLAAMLPAALIKLALGALLIWSAWKVFAQPRKEDRLSCAK